MEKTYTCGICNKEFSSLDEYLADVQNCVSKVQLEQNKIKEEQEIKEIGNMLDEIKKAKNNYMNLLNTFKEKYPKEYSLNFHDREDNKVSKESKNDSSCCCNKSNISNYYDLSEKIRAEEDFVNAICTLLNIH